MNDRYSRCLQEGLEFQDYVTEVMWKRLGIPLMNFSSILRQVSHGENVNGIEVKKDNRFRNTGNLFIETCERSSATSSWHAAGITKDDNSWLFVIGDEQTIYVFAVKHLRSLHKKGCYRQVATDTSMGFLLPIKDADNYCVHKLDISQESY